MNVEKINKLILQDIKINSDGRVVELSSIKILACIYTSLFEELVYTKAKNLINSYNSNIHNFISYDDSYDVISFIEKSLGVYYVADILYTKNKEFLIHYLDIKKENIGAYDFHLLSKLLLNDINLIKEIKNEKTKFAIFNSLVFNKYTIEEALKFLVNEPSFKDITEIIAHKLELFLNGNGSIENNLVYRTTVDPFEVEDYIKKDFLRNKYNDAARQYDSMYSILYSMKNNYAFSTSDSKTIFPKKYERQAKASMTAEIGKYIDEGFSNVILYDKVFKLFYKYFPNRVNNLHLKNNPILNSSSYFNEINTFLRLKNSLNENIIEMLKVLDVTEEERKFLLLKYKEKQSYNFDSSQIIPNYYRILNYPNIFKKEYQVDILNTLTAILLENKHKLDTRAKESLLRHVKDFINSKNKDISTSCKLILNMLTRNYEYAMLVFMFYIAKEFNKETHNLISYNMIEKISRNSIPFFKTKNQNEFDYVKELIKVICSMKEMKSKIFIFDNVKNEKK
jgi:hypothetical protein